ncbi:hypothetical protein [Streptomyces sp. NPDC001380]|uniref:hypothetical protein n=1 Tax=Streptomyces sp. NPDC001380 TaxID=3364566 RepID=UPI0036968EFD
MFTTIRRAGGAHRALDEARRHFQRVDPVDDDPEWVRYFDRTEPTVDTGIALGRLGDAGATEPLISEALRGEPTANLRGRAFHTFWLARTRLQRGEVESACATAAEALDLVTGVASPRVLTHLEEFRQERAPHRTVRPAVELASRIRGISR